ncbi:hypothetical protein EZS27_024207 [termite gut metagenome]|uniref:Uncharacterized protein n=1 Tax=termite gut metagenome TaxID=433724 RepID=A0A5J4QZQ4_9ZZZZ
MKSKKTPKISLKSRGSAVRIRQRPLENQGLTVKCEAFLFYMDTQFAHKSVDCSQRKFSLHL